MKILAIRGQNLASLAGRFEVALDDGPLAEAGLFAIVGETGAGKTTLLDAMCAALFDKTPRLEGHSSFKVGAGADVKQRLGTADVRALVRNGEAAGWAEVDFEGRDHRRYRARWEVQRARKRLDGNWQDQRMKLVRLDDGQVLGGTRTETLQAIRAVLGLSYDEFCRSALLAQFQFARFLKASASERAELLERMTGTRVYGDVSRAAHERARAFGEERARLRQSLAAINVLDDAARIALADEERAARAAADRGRAEQAALATAAAWRARAAALADEVAHGEAALARARTRRAEADTLARELADVERIAPVRGPWQARAEAARRMLLAEQSVTTAEARVRAATEAQRTAAARATAAAAHATAAREVAEAAAPQLVRARILDGQLASAARDAESAAAASTAASARAAIAARRVADLDAKLARATAALTAGESWLAARPARASAVGESSGGVADGVPLRVVMARDPERWRTALGRAASAQVVQAAARAALDGVAPRMLDAQTRLDAAARAMTQAVFEQQQAEALAATAEERARAAPLAPAERAAVAAVERARRVEVLALVARDATAAEDEVRRGTAEAEAADRAHADASQIAAREGALIAREGAALREAESTAARLRVAAGHANARAELVDGEPCPVCGAEEHPWKGGIVDALVAEQDARVAALRAAVDDARRALREAELAAHAAAARANEHRRIAAAASARRAALDGAWRDGLSALGELPLVASPVAPEAAAWIASALADAERARVAAEAARDAAQALHADAIARTAAARAALHALGLARDARDRLKDEVAALARQADEAERRRDEAGRAFDDARAELRGVLSADELRTLESDAASVRDALDPELTACAARLAEVERARAVVDEVRPALAAAVATAAELATIRDERDAAATAAAAVLAGLRADRAALLDGRPADDVERDLVMVRDAAVAEERAAAAALAEASNTLSSAIARRDDALVTRADALAEHTASIERVAAALSSTGIDERTAATLISRDAAWIATTRATLTALDTAVDTATAVAADRHRQAAAHAAQRPTAAAALLAAGFAAPRADGIGKTSGAGAKLDLAGVDAKTGPSGVDATPHAGRTNARTGTVVDANTHVGGTDGTTEPVRADVETDPAGATDLLDVDDVAFRAAVNAAAERAERAAARLATIEVERRTDELARVQWARAEEAIAALEIQARPFEQLAEVIGSADGKELRNFAQSLSLDALLAAANRHLDQLAPRYQLERVPGLDLELHVIDREMGGDARAVNGLSGGESFLVSLALALGLSSMAAADVEVRTLFIDEGFGSLDPATLDAALGVLDTLRASGRQVGIVSHVAELEDRVAASVAVRAVGGGRSIVQVRSARG